MTGDWLPRFPVVIVSESPRRRRQIARALRVRPLYSGPHWDSRRWRIRLLLFLVCRPEFLVVLDVRGSEDESRLRRLLAPLGMPPAARWWRWVPGLAEPSVVAVTNDPSPAHEFRLLMSGAVAICPYAAIDARLADTAEQAVRGELFPIREVAALLLKESRKPPLVALQHDEATLKMFSQGRSHVAIATELGVAGHRPGQYVFALTQRLSRRFRGIPGTWGEKELSRRTIDWLVKNWRQDMFVPRPERLSDRASTAGRTGRPSSQYC